MDLLERYLQAVRTYLPKTQQDDIVKELSENLRSQIEDQEEKLGRPLNEAEVAEMLKKHRHPMVVALRYRQSRSLIGPTLFPVYWFAVKVILVVVGFGYAVGALVMIAQGHSIVAVLGAAFGFAGAVLPALGWITVVFAVLELSDSRFHILEKFTQDCNRKFDARSLPVIRPSQSEDAKPISRSKIVFEMFWSAAFLLLWIRVSPIRQLALFIALGPLGLANNMPFAFGPVWSDLYVPVIVLTAASIALQLIALIYPERVELYSFGRLVTNAASLVLLSFLVRAGELLVLARGNSDASRFAVPLGIVNQVLHYVMVLTMILTAIECFKLVRRLVRLHREPAAMAVL